MEYNMADITKLDRVSRLKLINSITGVKPANLIGTADAQGRSNLAIFSSVIHLGSNPAYIGFVSRPRTDEVGHTYDNILATGSYTINHVHPDFMKSAHYTSGKFDKTVSEFQRCGLTESFIPSVTAPFVAESKFKMAMRFREAIEIPLNGTVMVIGEVEHLIVPEDGIVDGDVNLEASNSVGISGLNSYYKLEKIGHFPYVRVNNTPEF